MTGCQSLGLMPKVSSLPCVSLSHAQGVFNALCFFFSCPRCLQCPVSTYTLITTVLASRNHTLHLYSLQITVMLNNADQPLDCYSHSQVHTSYNYVEAYE
ncbi:hypothetical protein BsWGS_00655 [Bradybaena similaris]